MTHTYVLLRRRDYDASGNIIRVQDTPIYSGHDIDEASDVWNSFAGGKHELDAIAILTHRPDWTVVWDGEEYLANFQFPVGWRALFRVR